jgi:lactam utilization protein B
MEGSVIMAVTINCDMGEAFGLYHMGDDEALMPLIYRCQCGMRFSCV